MGKEPVPQQADPVWVWVCCFQRYLAMSFGQINVAVRAGSDTHNLTECLGIFQTPIPGTLSLNPALIVASFAPPMADGSIGLV